MNTKSAQRWEQTRTQGKWWFTLYRGVLAWGLPVGIISGMIRVFDYETLQIAYTDFMINLTMFVVGGGLVFGLGSWYTAEKEYQEYLKSQAKKERY